MCECSRSSNVCPTPSPLSISARLLMPRARCFRFPSTMSCCGQGRFSDSVMLRCSDAQQCDDGLMVSHFSKCVISSWANSMYVSKTGLNSSYFQSCSILQAE